MDWRQNSPAMKFASLLRNLPFTCFTLAFSTVAASAAPIVADFDGGNSTIVVDAYTGTAGNGWAGAWATTTSGGTATFTNTVTNTDPLSGGGNYLDASFAYTGGSGTGQGTVYRRIDTGVQDPTAPLQYSFDYRIDANVVASDDRLRIFGRQGASTGTDSSITWSIYAQSNAGTPTWFVTNGDGLGGSGTQINTGVAATTGTVFHFVVTTDPANKQWTVSITGGDSPYTSGTLGFRANSTSAGNTFLLGVVDNAGGGSPAFSFDNLQIVPEPAAWMLILGGMAVVFGLKRRRLV